MTELEIINAMLAAVGSNGVSSTVGRHPALMKAQPILNRVNKTVQNQGHWFNTEKGLTLHATTDGEIYVPQTTLKCDTTVRSLRYVRRGRRMYDPENQTYVLDVSSLDVDVVIELDYALMPYAATDYIRAKAVFAMLTNAEADQITLQAAKQDMDDTKEEFNRERRNQQDTSLMDNPDFAFIMGGLPKMHARSTNPKYIGG